MAVTSALSITALTLGMTAPAGADPGTALDDPDSVATATEELLNSPLLDRLPGVAGNELMRASTPQSPAAPSAASSPVVEETARTDTSFAFRVSLPNGEVTRDGAVLQAYVPFQGFGLSVLSYLTDAGAGLGALSYDSYEHQLLGLRIADLVRDNFTVTGATASAQGTDDHFTVPAGKSSFEITITSVRTHEELREALRNITGVQPEEGWDDMHWLAQDILDTRLSIPLTNAATTWNYGEALFLLKSTPGGATTYPNGANELAATRTGNMFNSTTTVTRTDNTGFSGDRVLYFQNSMLLLAELPFYGDYFEILNSAVAPPLRPGTLTTEVTGATLVRDGFYLPNPGVGAVSARTSGTGPQTEAEARTQYTAWVTDTCNADMSDPIPGYPLPEGMESVTWQQYLDEALTGYGTDDDASPDEIVYTGETYIDAVQTAQANQMAMLIAFAGISSDEREGETGAIGAIFPDWDAACGVSEDPGDDEPGDAQVPASINVNVPTSGVAGEPIMLSATVTDADDNPVSGREVTFTINEDDSSAGTLVAAARTFAAPVAYSATTLTATTGADGVATVHYTPKKSGTLHVSASTGGSDPVSSPVSLIPVTPDSDNGGDDDDDDNTGGGGGNQSGSGSLGSLFGSLGS